MGKRSEPPNFLREEALFWRELHDRVPEAPAAGPRKPPGAAELRERVHQAVRDYLRACRQPVDARQLELIRTSLYEEEFLAAVDVMLDDRMTMGPRTAAFEAAWAGALGGGGALMANSGSSANLLALAALAAPDLPEGLKPGDEVIVPAVAWSTSVFPIVQMGCVPVFVDVDPDTLNIDPAKAEEAVGPRTRALLVVHLLGNPCDMERIAALARRRSLWLVEDCCEAHGAKSGGRAVGTFGDLSTFSFYFSHHMTTVEGGMVCFQDATRWRDRLLSLRAHGWVRGRSDREQWKARYPDIDDRWLFVSLGYNLRPTDISAAIGLVQLERLPAFIRQRQAVRRRVLERLGDSSRWLRFQAERPGDEHSAFGLAMVVAPGAPFTRQALQAFLEERRIQTRPVVGSNFARQPAMRDLAHRVHAPLANADLVHAAGLMVGNHHDVTPSQVNYLADVVAEFLARHPS